jgi:hypothetical protein
MPAELNLVVDYHQQDTNYYCGAACAQMVFDSIGAGLLEQHDLYADNHNHSTAESGWYSGPDGMQWTMNHRRPAGFANYFALFELADAELISRKIVWTLHHYQVAPIALVYGSAHWIVVRGYQVNAAPSGSGDTSYMIEGFDINNPWPPVPRLDGLPPPHSHSDGCGTGGDRGIANEHITYNTWLNTYMTGVPGGHWAGKFVAICDPEPPAARPTQAQDKHERLSEDRLISADEAAQAAFKGFDQYKLAQRDHWKPALRGIKPSTPLLVHRLDRPNEYYYIVPLENKKQATTAVANVDALSGAYMQAAMLPDQSSNPFAALPREQLLKTLLGRRHELPEPLGYVRLYEGAFCLYPTLVWRPCRESLSPYYPFHMVSIGDHRLYIRIDGQVFNQLTTDQKGI